MTITIYYLKKDHYYNSLYRISKVVSEKEAKEHFERYCKRNKIDCEIVKIVKEKELNNDK